MASPKIPIIVLIAGLAAGGIAVGGYFFANKFITWPTRSSWVDKFHDDVKAIVFNNTHNASWSAYNEYLAPMVDQFGPRAVGSEGLHDAVVYTVNELQARGFNNVHTENVTQLKHWKRGKEEAWLVGPRKHPYLMEILGIYPSRSGQVFAEAIVVRSFAELDSVANASHNQVRDKIVVFNEPWLGSYQDTVPYRYAAQKAQDLGAKAVLVRSIMPFSLYSLTTGLGNQKATIPQACMTKEDAEMLWRMQQRGMTIKINLTIESDLMPDMITEQNIVFELVGKEKPEEVVLLACHIDSWDVGEGAVDDAGGCAVVVQAMKSLMDLGLTPKRTIRGVFFTADEVGGMGASQYFAKHQAEDIVFAAECDLGAFKPAGMKTFLEFMGNNTALARLEEIADFVRKFDIPIHIKNESRLDNQVEIFAKNLGIPATGYENMDKAEYYANYHHTNADYLSALTAEDIDYVAAVFAAFSHIIANIDQKLSEFNEISHLHS